MNIGPLYLENPVILAPLAGITNLPFRLLAKEAGCGLVTSEMVSADGLVHGARNAFDLLRSLPAEKPLAVQLFGSDPVVMAEAAAIVEGSGADLLDINFGCAVKKVIKTGSGAALMRTPQRAEALLRAVRHAVRIPLTIKIRSGWDGSGRQALALGEIAEACGVNAVTLHPRTASQKFSGRADWGGIAALKRHLSIPVIGNGDITCADDAARMLSETGCDAVMVGRRAIGYPRIFTEIGLRLHGEAALADTIAHRLKVLRRYTQLTVECFGRETATRLLRRRLGWFVKGMRNGAVLRCAAGKITCMDQAYEVIEAFGREN
jgi:nifR3 family TIM-barrel protein